MRLLVAFVAAALGAGLVLRASSSAARCPDPDTLVVGDACKRFGEDGQGFFLSDWASQLPGLVGSIGVRSLSYSPSSSTTFDGNVETSPLAYKLSGDSFGPTALRAYGVEFGLGWYPTAFTYVGAALAVGEGKYGGPSFVADSLRIEPRDSLNVSMTYFGGVGGLRLPLGPVSLRAEMAVGGNWISVDQYASTATNRLTSTASATALLIEPRAALDVWATPFLTVSLFASTPSFDTNATNAGLMVAGHLRAFDGRYGLL